MAEIAAWPEPKHRMTMAAFFLSIFVGRCSAAAWPAAATRGQVAAAVALSSEAAARDSERSMHAVLVRVSDASAPLESGVGKLPVSAAFQSCGMKVERYGFGCSAPRQHHSAVAASSAHLTYPRSAPWLPTTCSSAPTQSQRHTSSLLASRFCYQSRGLPCSLHRLAARYRPQVLLPTSR